MGIFSKVKLSIEPGAVSIIKNWKGNKAFKKYVKELRYEGVVCVERTDAEKHPHRLTIIGGLKDSNRDMVIVIDLEEYIYEVSRTLV